MAKRHYIPVTADVPGVSDAMRAQIRRTIRTALEAQAWISPVRSTSS